ncbi:MAG: Uncharacterized protein XD43_0766 [Thermococcales archaeon 44_46]|nr:MAG: Uncharacterized protein XD43_0766 [Thermococcales archaeon 44_46]HIH73491.1 hypothetical protein [Thermococcaceae archaeon]
MNYSEIEILGEILREGIYWAYMGRPFEVLPFLRGKLLTKIKSSNGSYKDKEMELERALKELEMLYKQISVSENVDEKQIREVLAYKQKFVQFLAFEEDL